MGTGILLCTTAHADRYLRLLREALPGENIAVWPQTPGDAADVAHIAVYGAPPEGYGAPSEGFFARFPNLRTIFALSASVDRLLARKDIAENVAIVRLTDAGMARQMTEYCLCGLLRWQRRLDEYAEQQRARVWRALEAAPAGEVRLGVLGLGELGGRVAAAVAGLGYRVSGWSRRPRRVEGVRALHGAAGLDELLTDSDALFCLLPSTPETRHLLDARRLALLPDGAAIINAGRGTLIDEAALLARLDAGRLRFAQLDVCAEEPLPENHPFWQHPRVILTPHAAAITVPEEAVAQIAANLRSLSAGRPLAGVVERGRGY
ncbi:MAG: glyoxylate/hydroxypyruvate reductase A [Candidatus Accumulibacter sp.]|jgi:glyoxylate/hydroxypyruvate reductase A|nr:glyoxylate/hydroxypyruvate reductase A [Accumulibacter sp.]